MTEFNKPYNPLDKKNLGFSVAEALLEQPIVALPPEPFSGAGVYAIYYFGQEFRPYTKLSELNQNNEFKAPIYVGKAVPAGARRGGFGLDMTPGDVLFKRLKEHACSIKETTNLNLNSFRCRYLIVDDIWIPLGESLLIEMFAPVWNRFLDGFGNHDPGGGRYNQQKSLWDTIHPGRDWANKLQPNLKSSEEILSNLESYFKRHLKKEK
ncbi:MAG TPA: Eco29kI family restriction endonuclease [Candidatus Paceibacterota bacterium]